MRPRMVPELAVRDIAASLAFYTGLGFRVTYERADEGFASIERDGAVFMLEAISAKSWITASLEPPLGRGINFEIGVDDLGAIETRLVASGVALFRPTEEAWYRAGPVWLGQRQFLVQDPDGYLLRFCESLGETSSRPERGRVVG